MEQLDYNLLFRWFVGLEMDDAVWDATVFTKNRQRLLNGEIAGEFFNTVLFQAQAIGFCHLLQKHRLTEVVFEAVKDLLAEKRLMLKSGTIVIVSAPSSTKNAAQTRDPEMKQTKKGNTWVLRDEPSRRDGQDERDLPSAVICFKDNFEVATAHLRFPVAHRNVIWTTEPPRAALRRGTPPHEDHREHLWRTGGAEAHVRGDNPSERDVARDREVGETFRADGTFIALPAMREPSPDLDAYFDGDGIHPNLRGVRYIAEAVSTEIGREVHGTDPQPVMAERK